MTKELILLLGGARSGKSTFAEKLASNRGEKVLYVATAQAKDPEMQTRISAHQQARPDAWNTLEVPLNVGPAVQAALARRPADLVLLDCLTLLVTNRILEGLPEHPSDDELDSIQESAAQNRLNAELDGLLRAYDAGAESWIIVSNEVGLGLVPPYPLGRLYRDLLGWANQRLAAVADRVYWMIAGLPVDLKTLSSHIN